MFLSSASYTLNFVVVAIVVVFISLYSLRFILCVKLMSVSRLFLLLFYLFCLHDLILHVC